MEVLVKFFKTTAELHEYLQEEKANTDVGIATSPPTLPSYC